MTIWIIIVFVLGYTAIALEHSIHVNKAASALITGVLCWTLYIFSQPHDEHVLTELAEQFSEISGILFFLLGSMFIVELIDLHDGFSIVYKQIKAKRYALLLFIICLITFFLSAFLNNLTTVIVMVTIIHKIVQDKEKRLYFIGMVVIAANSGGSWSPIGDVTTTMLWIGQRVSASNIIFTLFFPALASLAVPLLIATRKIKGRIASLDVVQELKPTKTAEKNFIFFTGLILLFLVPVFKSVTHLPPHMAILLGMGILWIITEILNKNKDGEARDSLSVARALEKIDLPSILFFLGILLAVGALQSMGLLHKLAEMLTQSITHEKITVAIIGLLSSIIDNVPLVAATMGMYPTTVYPIDHSFWEFLAYCSGTGGSTLIIGSAAGIAAMGIGEVTFGWYLKKISWLALIGFFSGIAVFLLQEVLTR